MTPIEFAYYLQGFNEIGNVPPTEAQWRIIQRNLESVFKKETPVRKPEPTYCGYNLEKPAQVWSGQRPDYSLEAKSILTNLLC